MEINPPTSSKPGNTWDFYIQKYRSFLIGKLDYISTLESLSKSLIFLVPGKYKDSDLKYELCKPIFEFNSDFRPLTPLVYSITGAISYFNDIIIYEHLLGVSKQKHVSFSLPPQSYSTAKWFTIIKNFELLIEIISQKSLDRQGKWTILFCLELLKCVIYLIY